MQLYDREMRGLRTIRKWMIMGLVIFAFIFSTPFVAQIASHILLNAIGCGSMNAFRYNECLFAGVDVAPRFEGYLAPFVISLLLTPLYFLLGFWDIILYWTAAIVLITIGILIGQKGV